MISKKLINIGFLKAFLIPDLILIFKLGYILICSLEKTIIIAKIKSYEHKKIRRIFISTEQSKTL